METVRFPFQAQYHPIIIFHHNTALAGVVHHSRIRIPELFAQNLFLPEDPFRPFGDGGISPQAISIFPGRSRCGQPMNRVQPADVTAEKRRIFSPAAPIDVGYQAAVAVLDSSYSWETPWSGNVFPGALLGERRNRPPCDRGHHPFSRSFICRTTFMEISKLKYRFGSHHSSGSEKRSRSCSRKSSAALENT